MAWRCTSSTNEGLVKNLQNTGLLKSEKAVSAMKSVDRKNYAPMTPYHDSPQSIGFGQTISAPHMHATVLEDLANEIQRPDSRILDVGCGSGYLTAVFARMNPTATVCGIDYIDELVELSKRNIQRADNDLLESKRVVLDTRDGWHGWPEYAPFDAIHVGAAATDVPKDLVNQLKVGGVMIIPLGDEFGQQLTRVKRTKKSGYEPFDIKPLMNVVYVPLVKLDDDNEDPLF
eukprot:gene4830-9629_t